MKTDDGLRAAQKSFAARAWRDAYTQLSEAGQTAPLQAEDLERFAMAAHLIGRYDDSAAIWTRAHQEFLKRGDSPGAARCAFWLAFGLLNIGDMTQAAGWLGRAERVLDDGAHDCVERGYLLVPAAIQRLEEEDAPGAYETFCQVAAIGERFGDRDLLAVASLGRGKALIQLGRIAEGVARLDEAMVAVTADEVSPILAGDIYCGVIEACQTELFDLRRAREWTAALSRWCDAQPDLVPYRGQCLVFRAELMGLHGDWHDAMAEAEQARDQLTQPRLHPAAGSSFYQLGELHRLRGDFARAESAYRQASQHGRTAQPGLALLRLMQGEIESAASSIRRELDEAQGSIPRARVLGAFVEVALAQHDAPAARIAAMELSEIASSLDAPMLQAAAARALGGVLLAEGDARAALVPLRQAWASWQELEVPYEAARVRVMIGLCCRALGDDDTAEMELDAARWVFQRIGAGPDQARVETLSRSGIAHSAGGLSERELQVLRLVAAGKSNRVIAGELFISEKTVARHVSNIFTKLGLSSRAAATAYAYERRLL